MLELEILSSECTVFVEMNCSPLLSLIASNKQAENVVSHPNNRHLVSIQDGIRVLSIGSFTSKQVLAPRVASSSGPNAPVIATVGRYGDIHVPMESIAVIQCSFEVDMTQESIVFADRSRHRTTRSYKANSALFKGSARRVDVRNGLDSIEFGRRSNMVSFTIFLHFPSTDISAVVRRWLTATLSIHPDLAATREDSHITPSTGSEDEPSPSPTLIVVKSCGSQELVYETEDRIGKGGFGTVYTARERGTGKVIAVKILHRPVNSKTWSCQKREVQIHSKLAHENIVQFLGFQLEEFGNQMFILTELQNGTLHDLIQSTGQHKRPDDLQLALWAFHDMLQALDYLAMSKLIHRDVKPENILFSVENDKYRFQLCDFGLSRRKGCHSYGGTTRFMAPEVASRLEQTPKVDMWSLAVTILWVVNFDNIRSTKHVRYPLWLIRLVILVIEKWDNIREVQHMIVLDPQKRATAAQMLVQHFEGKGLTTPRKDVPELPPPEPPSVSHANFIARAMKRLERVLEAGGPPSGKPPTQTVEGADRAPVKLGTDPKLKVGRKMGPSLQRAGVRKACVHAGVRMSKRKATLQSTVEAFVNFSGIKRSSHLPCHVPGAFPEIS